MTTLFVNGLTVIDFSYLDAARGLVGESWALDISLSGSLDDQGMVLDFSDVKKQVKRLVDEHFDHKLIIPMAAPELLSEVSGNESTLKFSFGEGLQLVHRSPTTALCMIDAPSITEASLSKAIIAALQQQMPANVTALKINLRAEKVDGAYYHYSHGLKHHGGNCQRIAHGHRSRIVIKRDGNRDETLEAEWAQRWRDIYIGSTQDLISSDASTHRYQYQASQGAFSLEIPAQCCYLIDTDSTVENIAQHIADKLHQQHPDSRFEVRAFEGIDKGAIGT